MPKIKLDYKNRCKHCAYLIEIESEWVCDIDEKQCKNIEYCEAVEK